MKKTLFSVFAAFGIMLGTTTTQGQTNDPACTLTPDKGQGYFVFNKLAYPNVQTWKLSIEQLTVVDNDSIWRLREEYRTPNGFYRLRPDFISSSIPTRVKIQGISSTGVEAEDIWIGAPDGTPVESINIASIRCNGKSYSWNLSVADKLNAQGDPQGGGKFELSGNGGLMAWRPNETSFFLNTFNSQSSASIYSPKHYMWGALSWTGTHPQSLNKGQYADDNKYYLMHNIVATDNIRDREGLLVTGSKWVVSKSLGQWINSGHLYNFETTQSGSFYAGQFGISNGGSNSNSMPNQAAWVNLINQNLGIGLACVPNPTFTGPSGGSGSGGSGSGGNSLDDAIKAMNKWLDGRPTIANPTPKPFGELMEELNNELSSAVDLYEHDSQVSWWPANEITHVFVFPVSVDGVVTGDPVQISKHLLVNEDGTLNNHSFSLEKGLYVAKLFIPNHDFVNVYFEVESNSVQSYPFANYLSASIYPVPLGYDQELKISATTSFGMTYEYTLTDQNGVILERKQIRARANEEQKFIFDGNSLPTGQLFHKFAFSDGSEVIYNTIKM